MKRKLILICTLVLIMSLCLTAALADKKPTPTPTPTPVPGTKPPPSQSLPQTGEVSDMWLIIMVLTGLCAITGAVLLILRRENRR